MPQVQHGVVGDGTTEALRQVEMGHCCYVYLDGVSLECPAEVHAKQHNSVLGPGNRFKAIGLAEGDVPPGPCPVDGGGGWSHGPGDEELQVVF